MSSWSNITHNATDRKLVIILHGYFHYCSINCEYILLTVLGFYTDNLGQTKIYCLNLIIYFIVYWCLHVVSLSPLQVIYFYLEGNGLMGEHGAHMFI